MDELDIASKKAFEYLEKELENLDGSSFLLINCEMVENVADHSISSFINEVNRQEKNVIFVCKKSQTVFISKIEEEVNATQEKICDDWVEIIIGTTSIKSSALTVTKVLEKEKEHVEDIVKRSFEHNGSNQKRIISSSYITSNGMFNAREVISDPSNFVWVVFRLVQLFISLYPRDDSEVCFLVGSMKGTPLAVSVKSLLNKIYSQNITLEVISNLGPQHHVIEDVTYNQNPTGQNYIYFADFIFGGTELKLAKSHVVTQNGKMKGAIVLGAYLEKYDQITLGKIILFKQHDSFEAQLVEGDMPR